MSLITTATFAQEVLNDFVRNGRPSRYLMYSDFFETYLTHISLSEIDSRDPMRSFDCLMRIFGSAAFIRWKHVRDFDQDAVRIAENMICPINDVYEKSGVRERLQSKTVSRGSIFYLTNFHPFAFDGVASCFGAYNLLDSFAEFAKARPGFSISVFAYNSNVPDDYRVATHISPNNNTLSVNEYRDFKKLIQRLGSSAPEYIFIDYFTYPYNLIPLLFPQSKIIYFGFGFSLFVFSGVRAIVTQEKTPLVGKFIEEKASHFKNRFVCPPRKHDLTPNLNVRLPENSAVRIKITEFRAHHRTIYATLCRVGKVSADFIEAAARLLMRDQEAGLVVAGAGCQGVAGLFPSVCAGRVLSLDQVPSVEVFGVTDVYLETFPEHQGLAVVEAMKIKLPVVFLDNEKFRHSLLSERAIIGRVSSIDSYVNLAERMAREQTLRQGVVAEQNFLLARRSVNAVDYWDVVFEAANS